LKGRPQFIESLLLLFLDPSDQNFVSQHGTQRVLLVVGSQNPERALVVFKDLDHENIEFWLESVLVEQVLKSVYLFGLEVVTRHD